MNEFSTLHRNEIISAYWIAGNPSPKLSMQQDRQDRQERQEGGRKMREARQTIINKMGNTLLPSRPSVENGAEMAVELNGKQE